MMRNRLLIAALLALSCASARAQAPQPSDAARALVGVWEFSNPDRDRRCTLTFKLDPAGPGRSVALGGSCATTFPDLRATAAWTMGSDDALKLVDAKGAVLFELNEVESGMYETTPSRRSPAAARSVSPTTCSAIGRSRATRPRPCVSSRSATPPSTATVSC
jgi:hypothetical protein